MATFTLPVGNTPDGLNANFQVGTAGNQPTVVVQASGANVIILPDGTTGTTLNSDRAGSSVHLYFVNQAPGIWFIKSLTGTWEIS